MVLLKAITPYLFNCINQIPENEKNIAAYLYFGCYYP